MPLYKALSLCGLILAISFSAFAQQGEKPKINENGQLEISPETAEWAKRQYERLKAPSFIKLKIEPVSNCQDEEARKVSDCYVAHNKIELKLFMTNTSSETINFSVNGSYYPYHVQLFRDGEPVSYREGIAGEIDKPPSAIYRNLLVKLPPGTTEMVEVIQLEKWYKPLEPGHYLLEIKRRFVPDGGWTDTASTTFEVEPQ